MQNSPLRTLVLAAAAVLAGPALAQQGITVVNFGGANGAAQKKAFVEAYEKSTGTKITTVEYNGEQARIKAMVEAKKVTWDVVEVEGPDISRGCDEGLFERLDWSKLGSKSDYLPAAVHECGVGAFVWSTVLAYHGDKLKNAPTGWADYFDVKKFPGNRGKRKGHSYLLTKPVRLALEEFSHVFGAPQASAGLVRVRAVLADASTAGETLVAQRVFVARRDAATPDAAGGAKALADAAAQVAEELAAWVEQSGR